MTHKSFKQKRQNAVISKMIFLLMMVFGLSIGVQAQVTIGLGEEPVAGALLQLKDKNGVTDDSFNATKGLVLPRVKLSKKDQLFPMFLTDPKSDYDPATNPSSTEYASNKAALDKTHTGLIVYNLVENDVEDLCLGLNQWNGAEWNCFETKMGNAVFQNVLCSDIEVKGNYVEDVEVNASHYLAITVTVIKEGAYSIVVKSERNSPGNASHGASNGYNYYLAGIALNKGLMTLIVPCQGKPVYASEENPASSGSYNTDNLVIAGLPMDNNDPVCPRKVQVETSVATYVINCNATAVNGQYVKGTPLTVSNTITVHVNVSYQGSYRITTPKTNGISFSASGRWPAPGVYPVTLYPDLLNSNNAPTINADFPIEIDTNTPMGNSKCTATIPITLPPMTYALIRNNSDYSWVGDRRPALQNGSSFGPNGTVKIMNLKMIWSTNTANDAQNYINNGFTGTTDGVSYTSAKPDIILYFSYDAANSTVLTTALYNYVNNGGVLIYAANSSGSSSGNSGTTTGRGVEEANMLIEGIFGSAYRTARWQTMCSSSCPADWPNDDSAYKINDIAGDQVINGPFGNLGGKYWAEDNNTSGTTILTALPPNSVQVCPAYNDYSHMDVSPDYSTVWYNENKNFFFFGDTNGASDTSNDKGAYPARYTTAGIPVSKQYGNGNNSKSPFTYVAHLELNAVAWALKKAAVGGINPH